MSYEKQTWQSGDTITANKLNHMESGIENSGGSSDDNLFVVTISVDGTVASSDKTWREITTAFNAGKNCIYIWDEERSYYDEGTERTSISQRSGQIISTDHYGASVGGQLTEETYGITFIVSETVYMWRADDPDSPIYYNFEDRKSVV